MGYNVQIYKLKKSSNFDIERILKDDKYTKDYNYESKILNDNKLVAYWRKPLFTPDYWKRYLRSQIMSKEEILSFIKECKQMIKDDYYDYAKDELKEELQKLKNILIKTDFRKEVLILTQD